MKNVFNQADVSDMINRINQLKPTTPAQWGKMNVGQMLAHCCVPYDMALTNEYPRPNFLVRALAKFFAKSMVIGPKPYPRNSRTAPEFIITDQRVFEDEKSRLIANVKKVQELGPVHFDGKESLSFGPLSTDEWNTLFYKHLDHHLQQFGV
jgi:hypothetical protein